MGINAHKCMLFMKGHPDEPKCGFSKQTVAILQGLNAEYGTFDILTDDEVRQGLKTYSNWPTFPQLYIDGDLIGGLDIIKEILQETKLEFDTFDILSDEEVRQGLKKFSNWPTYPQVYVKGELIGGLDIIKEVKEAGELVPTLKGEE